MTQNDYRSQLLGTGWAFPIQVNARGGLAMASAETDIEQSIRVILGTAKGERRMRPTFGCSIHELLFAPNDAATASLAERYAKDALGQWEPRIEVEKVSSSSEGTVLHLTISYRVRQTNERRNLVYPFYRIPEETEA
jgi:phage baseplate assembly protein W